MSGEPLSGDESREFPFGLRVCEWTRTDQGEEERDVPCRVRMLPNGEREVTIAQFECVLSILTMNPLHPAFCSDNCHPVPLCTRSLTVPL